MTESQKRGRKKLGQIVNTAIPKNIESVVQSMSLNQLEAVKKIVADQERKIKTEYQAATEKQLGKLVYKFRSNISEGNIPNELLLGLKAILTDGEKENEPENKEPQ